MIKKDEPTGLNNPICEAFGCFGEAKIKIAVEVGSEGTLNLFVCENCAPKFPHSRHQYQG